MTETYFHFTPEKTWPTIQREGLVPQPLKSFHHDMFWMCDDLGITDYRGIYIWPEVRRPLLRDFFIFKQTHERDVDAGLLLAVRVVPDHRLGHRWLQWKNEETGELNQLTQTHDLTFTLADGTKRKDHVAVMDIYLTVITPENIEPVARVYQRIEPFDNSSLAVDLGLTD